MRLAIVAAWVLAGGAVASGVYWAFLNTPESTVWALAASAVLLLGALALIGVTINGAILLWAGGPFRPMPALALRRAPAVVPATVIVVAVWWLVAYAEAWVAMRSGPINAWFIARFGWGDMSWLFATIRYAAIWTRWVPAALLAVWIMASLVHGATHRLSIVRVGLATIWFVVLVVVPWTYLVPWRPRGLPPTAVEPAFIAVKLFVAAAIIATGAALVIREASPRRQVP